MKRTVRSFLLHEFPGFMGFMLLLCAPKLSATNPNTHVSQYGHTAWRVRDGALSAPPSVIAQSADGYMWFGSDAGLIRFDGVNFVQWTPPHWDEVGPTPVQTLFAASDGTLWIGTNAGLATLKNGQFTILQSTRRITPVYRIAEDSQHHVWLATVHDEKAIVCTPQGDTLHCFGKADGIPVHRGEHLDIHREGFFTLASRDTVSDWSPEHGLLSTYTFAKLTSLDNLHSISALGRAPDGSELVGIAYAGKGLGLERLKDGVATPFVVAGFDGSKIEVQTLFTDRSGSLWIGTASDGLYKIAGGTVDHFTMKDGLSGNSVRWFEQDHEGNLWVATDGGVDCFRDLKAVSWSAQEGLTAGFVGSVTGTHDGSVLVSLDNTIHVIRNGLVSSIPKASWIPTGPVLAMLEDHAGRYWFSIATELVVYDGHTFKAIKRPTGEPFGAVASLAESPDGSIWARVIAHPAVLAHVVNDTVSDIVTDNRMRYAIAADGHPGIWVNGVNSVGHYVDGKMQWFPYKPDPDREHFVVENSLIAGDDGVMYTSTSLGVWGIKGGKTKRLGTESGLPCKDITGMVLSQTHSLVLHTQCGLVEIAPEDLRAWWSDTGTQVHPRLIDTLDGANVSNATYFPLMSLTPDGRIWVGDEASVQVIDPNHPSVNPIPPPVHIEEILADRVGFSPKPGLQLPALTRDIEIHYVGLSFSVPQKVRFRYMLENWDKTWQEVGARRTAFYQNVKPGHYRFRVLAANNDGVWNDSGDSFEFTVRPAWFQTVWWNVLWMTGACVLIWVIYRLRVRAIAKTLSARFDERLDERTRMALELHDTFLQTVQGSKMVADDALDTANDQVRMRHALEKLSLWLEQAVAEGRAALHALRVSTTERNHLAGFLEETAKEQCQGTQVSFALSTIGDTKDLHPIVRDEIARIAGEAIRNACRHSGASQLSIELRYARDLSLSFKDNGVGIAPEVLHAGKSGHFGIQGMKDRSERIRAKITITSTPHAGTEITLRVPGDVVYRQKNKSLLAKWQAYSRWPGRTDGDVPKNRSKE